MVALQSGQNVSDTGSPPTMSFTISCQIKIASGYARASPFHSKNITGQSSLSHYVVLLCIAAFFFLFPWVEWQRGARKRQSSDPVTPPIIWDWEHGLPRIKEYPVLPLFIDIFLLSYIVLITGGITSVFAPVLLVVAGLADYSLVRKHGLLTTVGFIVLMAGPVLGSLGNLELPKNLATLGGILDVEMITDWTITSVEASSSDPEWLIVGASAVLYILSAWWGGQVLRRVSDFIDRQLQQTSEVEHDGATG